MKKIFIFSVGLKINSAQSFLKEQYDIVEIFKI